MRTDEERYRCIITELAALLAKEKLPDADGATVLGAAIQIVQGMYERYDLPAVATLHKSEGESK